MNSSTIHSLAIGASFPKSVLVSGAGGQTGQSLFRKLLALPNEFVPTGIVRNEASKKKLIESGGVPADRIVVADVTDADAMKTAVEIATAGEGEELAAICICTSAKPAPTEDIDPETGRPVFSFPIGNPEVVDWEGQKNQIDVAPSACHIILCSTMGGTDPNHPLNNLGKSKTGEGGMIVQWKRKSEVYLMEQEGKTYTIVHPGGLLNEPGGERELVVGVDDSMDTTESRTVPREDVAQVMLEAIRCPTIYGGRSFDLIAKLVGDGSPTTDYEHLLDTLNGKNCDYSLGATM
eukprot:CAMPEP_0194152950 /NCGR_PEP_ID=MMETSP0152-20130528/54709_1 /TAXON_ID=1049557 /ORGANISM="Thalassiothrix antarctica, Strain L6-D1" /LENGTH=291 /DNA_ID=CAMNT_0038857923 /DNA_START=15 /DNA_END=890 /DNA_ORIENTATION=-